MIRSLVPELTINARSCYLSTRGRVTDAGNRLRCIFKRALALASPTRSASSHRVSPMRRGEATRRWTHAEWPRRRCVGRTARSNGNNFITGTGACCWRVYQPAGNNAAAGFHGGGGRNWEAEGNAQRAVDLSSLERHAHTRCVLIIPGLRIKKYCLARRADETSSRPMNLRRHRWRGRTRRSN